MEHITPVRTYVMVGGVLLGLTALTYGVSLVDLGAWNAAVALAIAAAKALLIVLYFMHGRYSSGLTRLAVLVALAWMALLMVGTLDDFVTRSWLAIPGH